MRYDFDRLIDRRNTNSLKFDFAVAQGRPADVLPLWVADMDFPAPQPVLDALRQRIDHGIFGYTGTKPDYYAALSHWFSSRFGWETEPAWLVKTPGVVFALAIAIRALTQPGDGILVQPPVYYPFYNVVRNNGRKLVENPLVERDGKFEMDFDDLEAKIQHESVKMLLLCSPHNPVCRVWTEDELRQVGDLCQKYGVFVVSDEIHCDFAFPKHPHTVFLKANPHLSHQAMVCTAPSKTFNLAGLQASNIWIPDAAVRERFQAERNRIGYSELNTMAVIACQAAYESGAEWLEQCKAYLRGNLDYLREFLRTRLPQLRLIEPEGTYFAWVDCSGLGLDSYALNDLILHKAKLWLDAGHIFGKAWAQYQRIVLACPRSTLEQALIQLEGAIQTL